MIKLIKHTAKNSLLLFVFFMSSLNLFAQQTVVNEVEMADQLRADGKIWVVVAVIATVFTGITLFLIHLDRKISKLENEIKK